MKALPPALDPRGKARHGAWVFKGINHMSSISIIGGGAWGTALAQVYARAGRPVTLWAREAEVVDSINAQHQNTPFLPGIMLHKNLTATGDLGQAAQADIVLIVVPTQFLRGTLQALLPAHRTGQALVLCCKGVEIGTGLLPTEIAAQILPDTDFAVLTGPTFAAEIARGLPAAVTLALPDLAAAKALQQKLATPDFRPYAADDPVGAQIGAAIKNVIAIACGMAHGLGLGESARAAIIARGLAEMARLAVVLGGRAETLMGLCGVGDLTLTCNSMQSRNFSLGAALGQGRALAAVLGERTAVTEGVYTAEAAAALARRHGVDMPIAEAVHACLQGTATVDTAVKALLNRPLRDEI